MMMMMMKEKKISSRYNTLSSALAMPVKDPSAALNIGMILSTASKSMVPYKWGNNGSSLEKEARSPTGAAGSRTTGDVNAACSIRNTTHSPLES